MCRHSVHIANLCTIVEDVFLEVASEETLPFADRNSTSPVAISCALNEVHCRVAVDTISVNVEKSHVIITFTENTTMPEMLSARSIRRYLNIVPALTGAAVGNWMDERTLEIIATDKSYVETVLDEHRRGRPVSVHVKSLQMMTVPKSGRDGDHDDDDHDAVVEVRLRAQEDGLLNLFAVHRDSMMRVSDVTVVNVHRCTAEKQMLIPSTEDAAEALGITMQSRRLLLHDDEDHHNDDNDDDAAVLRPPPKPVLHAKGLMALSGKSKIVLPSDLSEGLRRGSWSLTMWIRLLDAVPGEALRTLFYKGTGNETDARRTPSAWLLQTSTLITVRASTALNADLGMLIMMIYMILMTYMMR